jgi:oligoribonuclease
VTERDKSRYYLWFDTEYSSLNLEEARLLQVAMIITDHKLRRVTESEEDLILHARLAPHARFSAWHQEHLADVLAACRSPEALPVPEINRRLGKYIDGVLGPISREIGRRPVLAGNSIHCDVALARRLLPDLVNRIHYRVLDVTSLKLEWRNWHRGAMFEKNNVELIRKYFKGCRLADGRRPHDAYYDVNASIAELAYYRAGLQRVGRAEE